MNCKFEELENGDFKVTILSYHKFLNVLIRALNDATTAGEDGVYLSKDTVGNAVKKALS